MKGKEPKEWLQLGLIFLGLGLLGVLCWQAGQDILGTVHLSLAVFYGNVSYRAIVWVLFILVNGLLLVVLGLAALKVGPLAPNSSFLACLDSFRTRLGWARWVITVFLVMLPAVIILFVQKEDLIGAGALRMWILGMTAASFGIIFTRSRSQLIGWLPMLAGLLSTAVFFSFAVYMTRVIPYPFSMGWSEGNRLYDYSMIFGKERYSSRYPVEIPYYSPGRYALWGVAFLFPGLPIEIHRLWDGILWTIMPLLFGWFLTPRMPWKLRAGLAMWIALYLYQGPIYPMIFVSAILLSLAFRAQGMWKWLGTAAGSLYAGLSRWTWFSAVGVWGAILEQFKRPRKETNLIKRYVPAVLVFITGMVPGLLANAPRWLTPKESTLSLSQPLLWYRLFPNATYPQGILINLAVAVTPLVGFLAWLVTSRRWKPDWTQCLMILAACSAFLLAGLVASIKNGGGSNLHNWICSLLRSFSS
jgi:hypothetical protein